MYLTLEGWEVHHLALAARTAVVGGSHQARHNQPPAPPEPRTQRLRYQAHCKQCLVS